MDITQRQQQQQQQLMRMDCDEDEEGGRGKMQSEVVSGGQQGRRAGGTPAAEAPSKKAEGATDGGSGGVGRQQQQLTIKNRYVLHGKIDRGTFSTVSLASLHCEQHLPAEQRRMYAIKMITPTSHPQRITREIQCLKQMGGRHNVIGIVDGFREQNTVGLVMPYIPHEPFHQYYADLPPAGTQRYLQQLLVSLAWVHRHGVIHRDVKPSNFLYSPVNGGTYVLVDFGLAQETNTGPLSLNGGKDQDVKTEEDASAAPGATAPAAAAADVVATSAPEVKREDQVVAQQPITNATVRNPLKQQQQQQQQLHNKSSNYSHQSSLKLSNSVTKDLPDVPLARQVKSTASTICSRLLQKHRRSAVPLGGSNGRRPSPYAKDLKRDAGACGTNCGCYGRPQVCNRCLVRREMVAPRAGTPGYRPPEVLLKYPHQTTAVDVWAVGVIFMSLLGKVYPFFSNTDDSMSLAQFIEVFGYERLRDTARALDRELLVSEEQAACRPLSLRSLCQRFRAYYMRRETGSGAGAADDGGAPPIGGGSSPPAGRDEERSGHERCANCRKPSHDCLCLEREGDADGTDCDEYGPAAYDLLARLLEPNPNLRITAAEALEHPYFQVQY